MSFIETERRNKRGANGTNPFFFVYFSRDYYVTGVRWNERKDLTVTWMNRRQTATSISVCKAPDWNCVDVSGFEFFKTFRPLSDKSFSRCSKTGRRKTGSGKFRIRFSIKTGRRIWRWCRCKTEIGEGFLKSAKETRPTENTFS